MGNSPGCDRPSWLLSIFCRLRRRRKGPTLPPEPPPRDLGPIEIGPIAPELKHVDTETYTIDVEGPLTAKVKDKVLATITVKAKGDLALQNLPTWTLEPHGPRDVDFTPAVVAPIPPLLAKTTVKYTGHRRAAPRRHEAPRVSCRWFGVRRRLL